MISSSLTLEPQVGCLPRFLQLCTMDALSSRVIEEKRVTRLYRGGLVFIEGLDPRSSFKFQVFYHGQSFFHFFT